jgi:N6-L-threonylcarbamoyladenine synthase
VGGGVSANRRLRAEVARFADGRGMALRLPAMPYCLDNAAMIAGLAHWRLAAGDHDDLRLAPSARSTIGLG